MNSNQPFAPAIQQNYLGRSTSKPRQNHAKKTGSASAASQDGGGGSKDDVSQPVAINQTGHKHAKPAASQSTLRCDRLPSEIRPFLDSVDILSSTPPVHTSGLMGPPVTVGPLATGFHWMDDSESDSCLVCQTKFAWNRRQHHCRICGSLVCGQCSQERECPTKLVHDQPTSASLFWRQTKSAMTFIGLAKAKAPPSPPQNGAADVVKARACRNCQIKIQQQDSLKLYRLMESILTKEHQYAQFLDLRLWGDLAKRGPDWQRLVAIFWQALAQSQHFVTNPWIKRYRNATDLQKKVQTLLLWANQPLFAGHYCYSSAWLSQRGEFDQYWPQLVGKSSPIKADARIDCRHMRCKVRCDAPPTLEMQMHRLFCMDRTDAAACGEIVANLSFPLALALMPTMLIRGVRDAFYISCLRQLLALHGTAFGAPLYAWLQSITCLGSYLDQISNLFSAPDLARFIKSFKWGKAVCQAFCACRGDAAHKSIQRLSRRPDVLLPGSHNLIVEEIYVDQMARTESNASPYLLPCRLRNTDTNVVSKQTLLIKHKQSMFNDWVSMALIKLCAAVTNETRVQTYHMAPVGPRSGILIIVPDSLTVYEAAQRNSIFNLIYAAQPTPKPPVDDLRLPFSSTLAFFTILSCFLGWRDRIESNMMIHPASGTLFHIDFEYLAAMAPRWKATLRKYSGSRGGGFERSGDRVTMTSLIPQPVIEMIGGYGSDFYKSTFKTHCNNFYSDFYKLRHVFYYATECLCFAPSRVGRLEPAHHEQFFRSLELTFLHGVIISPSTIDGSSAAPSYSQVPISPLVIEPDQQKGWSLEGLFATMHSATQTLRLLK